MATRKAPETGPILDNEAGETPNISTKALSYRGFANIVRLVHMSDMERVRSMAHMTNKAMDRLGLVAHPKYAMRELPDGSDQVDLGTFRDWTEAVSSHDKMSVDQLLVIDATIRNRVGH